MLKKLNVRLGIIMALFTLAVLAVIPPIPVNINNSLLIIESNLGGYVLTANKGRWIIDLSKFKFDLDFGGGRRYVFVFQDTQDAEYVKDIMSKRLSLADYSKYNLTLDNKLLYLDIPNYGKIQKTTDLIGRRGTLVFKELIPDYEWDIQKFNEVVQDPSVWKDTQLDENYINNLSYLLIPDPSDQTKKISQITIHLSEEGRILFKQILEANIDKPLGLFVDNSQAPIAAPFINRQVAETFSGDPKLTGNFNQDLIDNLNVQVQTDPYPRELEFSHEEKVPSTSNRTLLNKIFLICALIHLIILVCFMLLYRPFGHILVFNFMFNVFVSLAVIKGLPVLINYDSIAAFGLFILILDILMFYITFKLGRNLKKDTPFNLAFHKVINKLKSSIKKYGFAFLGLLLISLIFIPENILGLIEVIIISLVLSMFSIFFILPTLVEVKSAFKLKEKKK